MPLEVTRQRFMFQTLGVIGGATVSRDLLPLLAEAAKRKQILRVAIERDFETPRPELSAGDTANMLRRLIYTTPILWGTKQRPDGSLIYDVDSIETVLATAYKVSEDRQLIEFTLRPNAKFANGDPINAQALKDSYALHLANGGSGASQLKVSGVSSADRIEVVDERFQKIINGEVGSIPLFTEFDNVAMREHVQGYVSYPDGVALLSKLRLE